MLDGATTLGNLRTWGCGLRRLQEPWIDTTTPVGEAMIRITIAWAGLEKGTLSKGARPAWRAFARRGGDRQAPPATV